jgi:hypothetical protein
MKSGAGDDPFADDEASAETEAAEVDSTATTSPVDDGTGPADAPDDDRSRDQSPDGADIPWVLRRDSVKGERDHVHQFFLRDEAARGERTLRSDVEDRLDTDVSKLDLREAAYLVAMNHPDEVAETLREWGYDYL